ncbi:MAG: hypothetical protein U0174_15205 [Polyangiaceae bacterium]
MRARHNLSPLALGSLLLVWACGTAATSPVPNNDAGDVVDARVADANESRDDAASDSSTSSDSGEKDAAKDGALDGTLDASDAGPDAADAAPDNFVPPTPAVRYIGRFEDTDVNGQRAGWPASRTVVRFDGTELSATLAHVNGFNGGPTYLDVIVDGVVQNTPLAVPVGTSTFTVVSGLAAGTHTVEFVKRTEAQHGVVQFKSFTFPNGGQLLAPPAARTRRIEVMGNSAISGYGVDGAGPNCAGGATPATYNARKSGAQVAADALSADLVLLGYGGKGVTKNITAGDNITLPILFERTLPETGAFNWSYAKYVPDAFVMVITNIDAETAEPTLTNAYEAFAIKIRAAYPNAFISLVVSAAATDDYPVGLMTRTKLKAMAASVVAKRKAAGDQNVSNHAMTEYVNGQLSGCDYHPNEALHNQMGAELVSFLKADLGW